jgi:hypothetical protein
MKGYKIKCDNIEDYIHIQKLAFELGYFWGGDYKNNIDSTYKPYLFLNNDDDKKYLTWDNDDGVFIRDTNKEIKLFELVEMICLRNIKKQEVVNSNYEKEDNKRESMTKLLNYFGRAY